RVRRPDEHGARPRAARAVLRPPARRVRVLAAGLGEAQADPDEGGPARRAGAEAARASAREAEDRLQPADGRLAARRARAARGLAPRPRAGRGARPPAAGGGRAARRDAPQRPPRRLAAGLEPDRARAVAARVLGLALERVAEERRDPLEL